MISALLSTRAALSNATVASALCCGLAGAAPPRIALDQPGPAPGHWTAARTIALAGRVTADHPLRQLVVTPAAGGPPVAARLRRSADGRAADWRIDALALAPGRNVLRIEARDDRGETALRYLAVVRAADASPQAPAGTTRIRGRDAPYTLHGPWAVVEGDVIVGRAEEARAGRLAAAAPVRPDGLGNATPSLRWPLVGSVVEVPYTVTSGNAQVAPAVAAFNAVFAGVIQWVPRTAQADWVDFDLDPNDHSGAGRSWVGRVGGRQPITGSIDVDLPTLLHEMGHAIGLHHEHSRADRDAYVRIDRANAIGSLAPNFDPVLENAEPFGLYDIASLMHYGAYTFTRNGEPTIETVPAGIPLGELGTYSASDIDSVLRIYGRAPSTVTVTTHPPGLSVVVDGNTVTTPATFNWALGSTHTLDVPPAPQTLAGRSYVYGRWNDSRAQGHAITVGRGNGAAGSPTNRPAVTVYSANFVELVPYAPFVWPAGSGSVLADPAPKSYPPLAGLYYVKRQPVALTASPAAGYSPYRTYTADGPVSLDPKTTRFPDWVLAYFTPQQKTTIATNPARRWVWVDGQWWEGPVAFTPYYPADGDWSVGSQHTVDVAIDPQQPYSWSIRYPFTGWSDGGGAAHTITVPAGTQTVTAGFGAEFNAWSWARQPCAGSVTQNPASSDGFYAAGTTVNFSQTPVGGWAFTGWLEDLAGSANPAPLAIDDDRIVVANYAATAQPVAISALAPPSKVAGQGAFTLKISGTGFTANSSVFIGGVYRAATKITATQIQVPVSAAEIAAPGGVQVFVQTTPPGPWGCSAYDARTLTVRSASTQPLAAASPKKLAFPKQKVGTTGTAQGATLANAGTTALALHDAVVTSSSPPAAAAGSPRPAAAASRWPSGRRPPAPAAHACSSSTARSTARRRSSCRAPASRSGPDSPRPGVVQSRPWISTSRASSRSMASPTARCTRCSRSPPCSCSR